MNTKRVTSVIMNEPFSAGSLDVGAISTGCPVRTGKMVMGQ